MKQKYSIFYDKENNQLRIQEFAELDKEMMSLLCEETYAAESIESAIANGKEALISALRTNNLYPAGIYADKIADAVMELLKAQERKSIELFFDDLEFLSKDRVSAGATVRLADDSNNLDELIEGNFNDGFEEKDELKKLDSSLKIADDDYVDIDDDT